MIKCIVCFCPSISFFFLLKIQIIYVVGPMSDVILISSIKSISKFQGKLFINYTVQVHLAKPGLSSVHYHRYYFITSV